MKGNEAKKIIEDLRNYLVSHNVASRQEIMALDIAIRSIEAREKIKEKACYMAGEDEKGGYFISLDDVLNIIDSYFEEVEK